MTLNKHTKTFLSLVAIAVFAAGFLWWLKWSKERAAYIESRRPMQVELERIVEVEGKFPTPEGFPNSIPLEKDNIVESLRTNLPEISAVQTSVTYRSTEEKEEKYTLYKSYMEKEGYQMETGIETGEVLSLQGTKTGEKLSITLSTWEGLTVVQIAHLVLSSR